MAFGNERFQIDDRDPEPDLSPMIDCVFILLIFFIVTATFVEEDGMQVNRPDASAQAQASESETALFVLTQENRVLHQGRSIGVDGVAGAVSSQLQKNDESPIVIQSHPKSKHGLAMQVQSACLEGGASPGKITLTDQ